MPAGPVPDHFTDILRSPALGRLAAVDEQGRPQVNPVWFHWDGKHVLLSVKPETRKYRNPRRDPHVAISVLDPARSGRSIELRGEVIAFELYEDLTFVNQLAQKYTGADFPHGYPGEHRYKLTVQINSWTGQQ